jgi:hypothetical protein
LVHTIKEFLDLHDSTETHLFSDSMVTLYWLGQDPSKWNIFVSNAVSHIQRYTAKKDWKHVPTEQNPADLLTRPQTLDSLKTANCIWWEGPPFVEAGSTPVQPQFYEPTEEAVTECRQNYEAPGSVVLAAFDAIASPGRKYEDQQADDDHPIAILNRNCSDPLKILRTTALILMRFGTSSTREQMRKLTWAQRITVAMDQVLLHLQRTYFMEERRALMARKKLEKSSRLRELDPFIDKKGLLRVGGRIDAAESQEYDFRHPIILPKSGGL